MRVEVKLEVEVTEPSCDTPFVMVVVERYRVSYTFVKYREVTGHAVWRGARTSGTAMAGAARAVAASTDVMARRLNNILRFEDRVLDLLIL